MDLSLYFNEEVVMGLVFGLLIIFLVLSFLSKRRYQEFLRKNRDLYRETMTPLIKEINTILGRPWPEFLKEETNLEKAKQTAVDYLTKQKSLLKKPKVLGLFSSYLFLPKEDLEVITKYDYQNNLINTYKEKVELDYDALKKEKKHNYYLKENKTYQAMHNVSQDWQEALDLYNKVQEEITEAIDAVSSASTMETIDMFSKNKAISVMSLLSTSSAQGEIEDIKPSLKRLENKLETLAEKNEVFMKEVKVSDFADLMVDLAFDLSFDFLSVMNMFALSRASDDLEDLSKKLKPLGSKLSKQVKTYEKAQEEYLRTLK